MKPENNESYKSWSDRVVLFEQSRAMMQIARGRDADQVMEEMSHRVMKKLLHPIFRKIKDSASSVEISAEEYYEQMKKRGPVPDHIDDDIKSLYNK